MFVTYLEYIACEHVAKRVSSLLTFLVNSFSKSVLKVDLVGIFSAGSLHLFLLLD